MEYFLLQQDTRYINVPVLKNVFQTIDKKKICLERNSELEEIMIFQVVSNQDMNYLDLIDGQLLLVSVELSALLAKYEPNLEFKTISLVDFEQGVNQLYYLPILSEVKCISAKSEFNLDRSFLKKVVLKEAEIDDRSIFKLGGVTTPYHVVRLDLAESICRRDFKGIKLTRLQLE